MKIQYNVTSGVQSSSFTQSYTTVYVSATTYKINLVSTAGGKNTTSIAWILKNGTALAIDEAGYNLTGSFLSPAMLVGFFAGFSAEIQAGSQLSTNTASQYFHSTGTSSVTLGSNTFTVTNYAANTLPETLSFCNVAPSTLTSYNLSVGTPKGSTYEIVTSMQIAESSTTGGVTTSINVSIQVVSLTVG